MSFLLIQHTLKSFWFFPNPSNERTLVSTHALDVFSQRSLSGHAHTQTLFLFQFHFCKQSDVIKPLTLRTKQNKTKQNMGWSEEQQAKTTVPPKLEKKSSSVLKKHSAYSPIHKSLEHVLDEQELLKKFRLHEAVSSTSKLPEIISSQDDCLVRPSTATTQDPTKEFRLANMAWRRWHQRRFKVQRVESPGTVLPHVPSPQRRKRVSFKETVEEQIIPPRVDPYLEEDPVYENEDEPGFIDNLGSVCGNILLTISSFLAPYYSTSSKFSSGWL